ncbi:MAG: hypothetical protein IJ192_00480 [Clostridia bacterium]|nr:hypothetical protein [Clostridia bacterium]
MQKAVNTAALAGIYCLCANFVLSQTISKFGMTDETGRLLSLGLITLFTMLPPSLLYLRKWKDTDLFHDEKNKKCRSIPETISIIFWGFAICAASNFVISLLSDLVSNGADVSSGVLFDDVQGF